MAAEGYQSVDRRVKTPGRCGDRITRMRRSLPFALLLAIVAAGSYAGSLGHGFVWDDDELILQNRYLRDWSEAGTNLTSDFFRRSTDPARIGYWRPAVTLSYMVDVAIHGTEPFGFHLTNVLLHVLVTLVLWELARRLPLPGAVAVSGALLFAVHPVHAESVAWVSGRTDLLCALFFLAALLLENRRAAFPSPGLRTAALAAASLSLLSKEMAAVFPLVAGLRAWFLPAPAERDRPPASRAVRAAVPYAAVVLVYGVVRLGLLGVASPPAASGVSRWHLFLTWWAAVAEYARVLVWPARLDVQVVLPVRLSPFEPAVLLGVALLGALAWTIRLTRRTAPEAGFLAAWLLVSLGPLTNFVLPIRSAPDFPFPWAERFLYVPSAPFCLGVAWILLSASRTARGGRTASLVIRRVGVAAVVAAIALFAARTFDRVRDWKSDRTLFAVSVGTAPGRLTAHLNLANAMLDAGELDAAAEQYARALDADPTNPQVHYNMGNLELARGSAARAIGRYREALRIDPGYPEAHLNLGIAFVREGRFEDALAEFRAADGSLPDYVDAKTNLANTLRLMGRTADSIPVYRRAVDIDPDDVPARVGLAGALASSGDLEAAERIFREVLAGHPESVQARYSLGAILERTGRREEAREQFLEVLRLQPDHAGARSRL